MKLSTKPLILSALVLSALAAPAAAEVSANFGATSNYLWRGTSLSNEGAAVYGGLDYSHDSGIYAGFWQSSEGATGSAETDLYAGFSTEVSGVSIDVGAISYMYLQADTFNFNEVYANVGFEPISASVAYDSANKDMYFNVSGEFAGVSATFGSYSYDNSTKDYTHFDLSYSPADSLTIGLSKNDTDTDGDPRLYVSYGIDFEVK